MRVGLGVIVGALIMAAPGRAQGPLVPPGAPTPSMKTLQQIEPRTPIETIPFVIHQSGHYYVTTNQVASGPGDGIQIFAQDVTVDLNGFVLDGAFASGNAVFVGPGLENVRIHGGTLINWAGSGVEAFGAEHCRVTDVDTRDCGYGVRLGRWGRVENCRILRSTSSGVEVDTGSVVVDSEIGMGTGGTGVFGPGGCTVQACRIYENTYGVQTMGNSRIMDCEVRANEINGIEVYSGSTVLRNLCTSNGVAFGGSAIFAVGPDCRVEDNVCEGNDKGIEVLSSNCTVRANRVLRSGFENYLFDDGNKLELLLCEIPETIGWPARVELIGPLWMDGSGQDGIIIEANHVTIDLNGHTLHGSGFSSGHGIYQETNRYRAATVRNGSMVGWQGSDRAAINLAGANNVVEGIAASSNVLCILVGPGSRVEDCSLSGNEGGSIGGGVFAGAGSTVTRCAAYSNRFFGSTSFGIYTAGGGVIEDCTVYSNEFMTSNSIGIGGLNGTIIRDCSVMENQAQDNFNGLFLSEGGSIIDSTVDRNVCMNGVGAMISAGNGVRVQGCTAVSNEVNGTIAFGIGLGSGSIMVDCVVRNLTGSASNQHAGIWALLESQVVGCTVTGCAQDGIVVGRDCVVQRNQSHSNVRYGIMATASGNKIDGNGVNGNATGMFLQGTNNLITANSASVNTTTNFAIAVGNAHGPIVNVAGAGDLSLLPNAGHPLANLSY